MKYSQKYKYKYQTRNLFSSSISFVDKCKKLSKFFRTINKYYRIFLKPLVSKSLFFSKWSPNPHFEMRVRHPGLQH